MELLGYNSTVVQQLQAALSTTPSCPIMDSFEILVLPIRGSIKACLDTSQNESFCEIDTSEVHLKMAGALFHSWVSSARDAILRALIVNQSA